MNQLTEEARKARLAYQREYRRRPGNLEKHRECQRRYWERKAAAQAQTEQKTLFQPL